MSQPITAPGPDLCHLLAVLPMTPGNADFSGTELCSTLGQWTTTERPWEATHSRRHCLSYQKPLLRPLKADLPAFHMYQKFLHHGGENNGCCYECPKSTLLTIKIWRQTSREDTVDFKQTRFASIFPVSKCTHLCNDRHHSNRWIASVLSQAYSFSFHPLSLAAKLVERFFFFSGHANTFRNKAFNND